MSTTKVDMFLKFCLNIYLICTSSRDKRFEKFIQKCLCLSKLEREQKQLTQHEQE
jgi:hypothetical protein